MIIHNDGLREVYKVLLPTADVISRASPLQDEDKDQKQEQNEQLKEHPDHSNQGMSSINTSSKPTSSSIATSNAEFIPHLFYSLHQIRKDPDNSANHLETATGFIRHRLKTCKSLIENNEDCKKLLSKSTEEWHEFLKSREEELRVKRNVLHALSGKLMAINDDN